MLAHLVFSLAIVPGGFAALVAPSPAIAALIAPSPAIAVADPYITPGPSESELRKRQNSARFIGYLSLSDGYKVGTCSYGYTYFQTDDYWNCCTTSRGGCNGVVVSCFDGTLVVSPRIGTFSRLLTGACTDIFTDATDRSYTNCATEYLFENDRGSDPKTKIACGLSSYVYSYYRSEPVTPNAGPITPPSTPTPTPTPTPRGPDDIPIITPIPQPEEKSESKAWIAGAVIGPIVGLALIGLGVFFFLRRRKNKKNSQHVAPASGTVPAPGASAYQQNTYNTHASSQQPPQYQPNMQQTGAAAPVGTGKHDSYYNPGPQSPISPQGSQGPFSAGSQTWQQGAQPVYGGPSPSVSPPPQNVQPAPYNAPGLFSSELDAGSGHGQPVAMGGQPKP